MKILITGGAGFIGSHASHHFSRHHEVKVIDNLSRVGSDLNWQWLQSERDIELFKVDIRDAEAIAKIVKDFQPDALLHFAGQVAVTTSVANPREDFEINALGTLNLLEAVRCHRPSCAVLFSSTNKVYGGMEDVESFRDGSRYRYRDLPFGASEERGLDFHSPYGCSKGAADQYVRDYQRIYDIPSVVFRQSCCYGTRQFGVEDQGWLAWFSICASFGKPVKIYGDGAQVRDILWISDLIAAYSKALERISAVSGSIYNLGGGPDSQLSLLELIDLLKQTVGIDLKYTFEDWRPGDQRVFVADTRKAQSDLGWATTIQPEQGVQKICQWIDENRGLFRNLWPTAGQSSRQSPDIQHA